MRIAFDGSTLRPGRTGVGYYTEHLLQHVASEAAQDELLVVSNRSVDTTRPLPPHVRVAIARGRLPRLVWMQTQVNRQLAAAGADLAHFTNGMVPLRCPVPTVVTIHDMSLTLYPHFHPARRILLNRPLVNIAARRADAVITVSESAKRDIVRLYDLPAARVHVVHEAAAPSFRRVHNVLALERARHRYQLAERCILYVGTIEPRKNLPNLIEAFARRRASGDLPHQLVCVGPYGWLSRDIEAQIDRLGVRDAIRFTGYVPFDDLPALYTLAELFVFPSLYEGFGLPVMEAMACGTPVVIGRVAALAEVAGGAVDVAESLDADAIGESLVALAADRDRRQQLTLLGLERARLFSWDRAARETLNVYRIAARQPVVEPAAEAARAEVAVAADAWPRSSQEVMRP